MNMSSLTATTNLTNLVPLDLATFASHLSLLSKKELNNLNICLFTRPQRRLIDEERVRRRTARLKALGQQGQAQMTTGMDSTIADGRGNGRSATVMDVSKAVAVVEVVAEEGHKEAGSVVNTALKANQMNSEPGASLDTATHAIGVQVPIQDNGIHTPSNKPTASLRQQTSRGGRPFCHTSRQVGSFVGTANNLFALTATSSSTFCPSNGNSIPVATSVAQPEELHATTNAIDAQQASIQPSPTEINELAYGGIEIENERKPPTLSDAPSALPRSVVAPGGVINLEAYLANGKGNSGSSFNPVVPRYIVIPPHHIHFFEKIAAPYTPVGLPSSSTSLGFQPALEGLPTGSQSGPLPSTSSLLGPIDSAPRPYYLCSKYHPLILTRIPDINFRDSVSDPDQDKTSTSNPYHRKWNTKIPATFTCPTGTCKNKTWSSSLVPIVIRSFPANSPEDPAGTKLCYSVIVYNQRCRHCNSLGIITPDLDAYVDRVVRRLKIWLGRPVDRVDIYAGSGVGGRSGRRVVTAGDHEYALCEGCKAGDCEWYNRGGFTVRSRTGIGRKMRDLDEVYPESVVERE